MKQREGGIVVGQTDLITADDEESTDGREDDANYEKRRKDRLWCQNRLPGLQPLLLERGIYADWSARGSGARTGNTYLQVASNYPSPFLAFLLQIAGSSSYDEREPWWVGVEVEVDY